MMSCDPKARPISVPHRRGCHPPTVGRSPAQLGQLLVESPVVVPRAAGRPIRHAASYPTPSLGRVAIGPGRLQAVTSGSLWLLELQITCAWVGLGFCSLALLAATSPALPVAGVGLFILVPHTQPSAGLELYEGLRAVS